MRSGTGGARRRSGALLLVLLSMGYGSSAHADVLVGGAHQASEPLVIAPQSGAITGNHFTYYDQKLGVIQRMPSTKAIDSVTLGDIGQSPGCPQAANTGFSLSIRESATGHYAGSTVVASSSAQVLPMDPGKVTWSVPETTLTAGRTYWFDVTSGTNGCAGSYQQRTWDTEQPAGGLEGGPGPCEPITSTYGGNYYRVWHTTGADDWTCTSPGPPSSFDPSLPTGWLLVGGYYQQPLLEHRTAGGGVWQSQCYYDSTGVYWKPEDSPYPGGSVAACALADFADAGVETDEGWFYAYDADASRRAAYVELHTVGWSGPPRHWDSYGGSEDWDHPQDSELNGAGNPAEPNVPGCKAGDPVDCATGNLTETTTDLSVAALGDLLTLSRTYNAVQAASAPAAGPFGHGWSSTFAQRLTLDGDGRATIHQGNGSTATFWPDGSGGYVAPARVQATLVRNADGTFDYTLPDRSWLRFDEDGRLLSLHDRNDNATAVHYDVDGNVTDVTASGGRSITFDYNTDGTVATATSTGGREVHYGYTDGDLTSVTDVRGGTWAYTYDAEHRLTQIEDPRGHHVSNSYDGQDRVVTQTDRRRHDTTWDYDGPKTTVTDPEGHVREITFEHNVPVTIVTAKGTADEATKLIDYDDDGNPVTVTDGRGHEWHYEYDGAGNRTSATDPLDRETTWTYDAHRDVLSETLPSGLETTYDYDAHGNPTAIARALTPTQDQTTTLDYDGNGNLVERTDPLAHAWTYDYNGHGDLTSATSPLGHETSYSHDLDGFVTAKVSPRGHLSGADPEDFTTTYVRNADGQPTTITDPLGHDTLFGYDANGNLTSSTDADGRATQTTYDATDQPTIVERGDGSTLHTGYDDNGLVVSQTDGEGHETTYARDAQGRVSSVTDPDDRTTSYAYDDAGNRTSLTDPDNRTTTYTYDDANQPTAIHSSSGHPGDVALTYTDDGLRATLADGTGTSTWTYDALDRLASSENGVGQTVGYDYDLADRPTSIDYPDALVPGPPSQTPSTVDAGTVTRAYDADDRLTSVEDWLSHTTTFTYNVDDVLAGIERPDGTEATHTVDRDDRLTAIDDAGDEFGYSVDYTRTDAGLLASATETGDGAGPNATYAHDDAARLTGSGTGNQSYGYDDADNLTQLTDASDTRKQTFDDASQLTAIKDASDNPLADLDYDAEGNRTALTPTTGPATTYSYDQANQLTQDAGPITQTYGYDGDGLRQYTQTAGDRTHHTWDRSGGLPLMIQDGATSYVYGPGGLVIEQITAGADARYYHQDQLGSTRALTNQAGEPIATYTYTPYGAPKTTTGTATNPFRYAGQYTDATGLQYLRARYYDPATGQFLTRDPIEAITGQAYAYASGAPTDLIDLTGQWPSLPPLQDVSDFVAGAGDALTMGGTTAIRHAIGSDGTNYCSDAYTAGGIAGTVGGLAVGAAPIGAAKGGAAARGLLRRFADETGSFRPLATPGRGVADVTFGHGARHLAGTGLAREDVELAIQSQIRESTRGATVGGAFGGRVTVSGRTIEYRAFGRDNGTINVGTYYLPR